MTTPAEFDRRSVLKLSAAAAAASLLPASALAKPGPRHGLSVFGDLKYPVNFSHFNYVNPNAPKGGRMVYTPSTWAFNQNPQTFNTLNTLILKGAAPPGLNGIFGSLMVRALDEADAMYGMIAETVEVSGDGNTYSFKLRRRARFHDGSPLTAQDVQFSLLTLKAKGHPEISQTIREMVDVKVIAADRVDVVFSGKQSRQLPMVVAGLPILSKAWYASRDFEKSSMEAPLGSGPLQVGKFDTGRYIEYERVKNWWAADLPVNRGFYNFDVLRIEFFRDRVVAFEAFKKGKLTFREDFFSKIWATEYNFPAILDGRVKKVEIADDRPAGAQGWFLNTRRKKFADPRTREAIGLAFDFEWSNKNLFYGLYQRTHSFFQNSQMMADGLPSPEELALLEPHRAGLPAAVFDAPWLAPKSDGSGRDRALLRRASKLLQQAGWKRQGSKLVDSAGVPLDIEFLTNSPSFERIIQPYIQNLKLLGITGTYRLVDPAQYQSRLETYDFDTVGRRYALSATPSEAIRRYWGSQSAKQPGNHNLAGITDPVVDALMEKLIHAESRQAMTVAARALDRVLRAGHYWVSNWYKPIHTVAVWDHFGWPEQKPRYGFPFASTWWIDPAKADKLKKAE